MKIRSFQPSDRAAIVRLWNACGLVVPHNDPNRDIDRKLTIKPDWFLVGEVDRQVIASCMVGYEGHRGWLNYLAVRPDMQNQGLGQQIVSYAEALLLQAGCPKINLQIRSTNQRVIEFYEGLGYEQDPVISMGKRLIPDIAK
ncbi:GNAT family acetyltransferase [Vacuolonema iberomarrocanum]|uniref:GNAT family acetyltransferase n=1 Tax=Vacuolonema iberomarrocanum TaxID=3454632 RepID=UPI001A0F1451|nr:GNAT family acetyltransferase [filamentous cyanobacterium LEGE 07170]